MLSRDFVNALLWLAGGTASFLVALNWAPAVFVDGQILPTGHDSFYHARRILDAANAPAGPFDGLYQFDARIHVPEGSWVTWPWGYDFTMAAAIRAAIALWPVSPELALVYVPALWVYVNAALVVGIARALNLGPVLVGVALGCFALSPLTGGQCARPESFHRASAPGEPRPARAAVPHRRAPAGTGATLGRNAPGRGRALRRGSAIPTHRARNARAWKMSRCGQPFGRSRPGVE